MPGKAVYHLVSEEETLTRRITLRLSQARKSFLATAFFTSRAYTVIEDALVRSLAAGGNVIALIGRYDFVTEPKAVRQLLALSKKYPGQINVYFDGDFYFHYKLAVFDTGGHKVVIIGSSNLTTNGLLAKGECNLEAVNNRNLYRQSIEAITRRLKQALPAETCIDDYEQKYRRAAKLRKLRRLWRKKGAGAWRKSHAPLPTAPEGNHFPYCWIEEYEEDRVLRANIKQQYQTSKEDGAPLPGRWVHLPTGEFRRYPEGSIVVVRELDKRLGFAVCTKRTRILDEHNKQQTVVFYKFLRHWSVRFKSWAAAQRVTRRLGLDKERANLGAQLSGKLKSYLHKRTQQT